MAAGTPSGYAEVAVIPGDGSAVAATLQIHDRDASPLRIWSPVRQGLEPRLLLNPDGDRYLDGAPSIAFHPVTKLPEAVWSFWDGGAYQIAWSRFDGTAWSMAQTAEGPAYELITSDARQNFDPRIHIDASGNRRVVWWRRDAGTVDEVVVSVLPPGETQWWAPQVVSTPGVPTRRPDIRAFPGFGAFIIAEEDSSGTLSLTVFHSPSLTGDVPQRESEPWGRRLVRTAGAEVSLDGSISAHHMAAGQIPRVTWREGDLLVTSLYDPEAMLWTDPVFTPWPVW